MADHAAEAEVRRAARAQRQADMTARMIADNEATTAYIMGGAANPNAVSAFFFQVPVTY